MPWEVRSQTSTSHLGEGHGRIILVDTSIWIDHFPTADPQPVAILTSGEARIHQWIVGELAMRNLADRDETLRILNDLPRLQTVDHHAVMAAVEEHKLYGHGIGYVDAQLLASTTAIPGARLWSRDPRLRQAAERAGIVFDPKSSGQTTPTCHAT